MFKAFLESHSINELLVPWRCPFPPAADRAAWEGLPCEARQALLDTAARYRAVEYPVLTASRFMAFARTGDRGIYEAPYFLRRKKLIAALLGVCAAGTDDDLDAVIDGLWLICEETSWVISAHNGSAHEGVLPPERRPLPDIRNPYVDLFAAQSAMILSLTCALLGDALDGASPLIRRRVRAEVERRVLVPFETRDDFWWMGITRRDLCNWTPWIVSNVMLTACAWIRDRARLGELLERGCAMLDRYLDVLPEDGGCDEGAGYWSMAGGALLDCLQLLEEVTGGRMAFWDDAKLKNVLRYPLNAWIGGEWFVNYADCDARPEVPGERLEFAGQRLGDPALVAFGARFRGDPGRELSDTPQLWRLLNSLFRPKADGADAAEPPRDVWLPNLETRMVRRAGLTLVIKGGVNEGSHNHNDCGSFMLYADGEPEIVDAGNMTYTGKTFSGERYSLWNTRGKYHNVPMIGGFEQINGWERRARDVRATEDGLTLDIANAYPAEAGVLRCVREAACGEGGCRLRDVIDTREPQTVTETLLLRHPPEIDREGVSSGALRIVPGPGMAAKVEEIPVTDPRMAKNFPGSLWRVTFTAGAACHHDICIHIGRKDV